MAKEYHIYMYHILAAKEGLGYIALFEKYICLQSKNHRLQ